MDGHCLLNVPQQLSATLPRSGPVMYVQVGMSCEEPWTTMDMESLPPPMCLYLVPSSSHAKKGKTRKKSAYVIFGPLNCEPLRQPDFWCAAAQTRATQTYFARLTCPCPWSCPVLS